MDDLSLSKALDDSEAIFEREGRLLASIILGLLALPATVSGVVSPRGLLDTSAPWWASIVVVVAVLIMVAGHLALIRLAVGPSTTVRQAIFHGLRRMPIYVIAGFIIAAAMIVLGLPLLAILAAAGVPLETEALRYSPLALALALYYFALALFIGVRMMIALPAASLEPVGPVDVVKLSWQLSNGHWWRLFGFLMLFTLFGVLTLAGVSIAAVVVSLLLGPIEPLSWSALILAIPSAVVIGSVMAGFTVMLARVYVQLAGR